MTVAEMSPIELYATVMAALIVFSLSVLGVRQWDKLDSLRHKAIFVLGLFAAWGLPFLLFINVARPN